MLIPWPNVGVQKGIEIAVDAEIHTLTARSPFDSFTQRRHISQKLKLTRPWQRNQLLDHWVGKK